MSLRACPVDWLSDCGIWFLGTRGGRRKGVYVKVYPCGHSLVPPPYVPSAIVKAGNRRSYVCRVEILACQASSTLWGKQLRDGT